jgi:Fur family peroxide stress response transcriptional regulator
VKHVEKYRKIGFKLTPQRIAILDYLEGNRTHPSAEDIYKAVSEKFPTMSFATVYNTMEALAEKKGVIELNIDTHKKRFDPDTRPHNHLICTKCRKVVDVFEKYSLDVPEDEKQGFKIMGNQIEFYGICSKCRSSSIEERNSD